MEVHTTRFGRIHYSADDLLSFPEGLPGLTECREWVLLADPENDAVAWLQSVARPETALAVVSPRRFLPNYQLRVCRRELEPLGLDRLEANCVVAIVSPGPQGLTMNLQAPLVIDGQRRVGRQVIANGPAPMHCEIRPSGAWKKTA